ncbi:MAG: aminotransferase class V-fold PLP-dependent enzyme [Chitinophagales bacterium]|nr:aminotransferase class V-fold PLP-dependent enzyme [Chitinophagales bacterium]
MLEKARNKIAVNLQCPSQGIYFSSSATEAANILIHGRLSYLKTIGSKKNKILISSLEHSCVYNTTQYYKKNGYEVLNIPCDRNGIIDLNFLRKYVSTDTAIVCVMGVNNEIGTIQDINNIGQIIKENSPDCFFICDVVQQIGKIPYKIDCQYVDSFFFSGHKIGGPKGIGAFYVNDNFRLLPKYFGGGHEKNYRSGTVNVEGACLLSGALELAQLNIKENLSFIDSLNKSLLKLLVKNNIRFKKIIPNKYSSPYICSIAIEQISSKYLQKRLSEKDVCVARHSACLNRTKKQSRIINAIKLDKDSAESMIRLSYSIENTVDEIHDFVNILSQIISEKTSRNGSKKQH